MAPIDKVNRSVSTEEWEALNARLRATEAELERLRRDGRHDEFLAMLAHEFRNPLAPIRSAVEIMRVIGQKDAALEKAREVIARQVDHLSRLVDDLLDVTRMTQGQIHLTKAPVEVNALLANAAEAARRLLDERGHTIEVVPLERPAKIDGDSARLVQAIGNLLENAVRHTEAGGEIILTAVKDDDAVTIHVKDNGSGIEPEQLPHVFDFFTPGLRSTDGAPAALGIGLSLVRTLVELHGGSVEAKSDGLGRGSEFIISLPLLQQTSRAVEPLRSARSPDMPRRIVVIDDNLDAAESLAMLLRLKGHEVYVAYDGPSGVALALKSAPDCVLVDIGLPGIDGYEVAKRLRAHEKERMGRMGRMLLVALTGYGQDEDRARSEQAGFDHHLVKPVAQNVVEDLLRDG